MDLAGSAPLMRQAVLYLWVLPNSVIGILFALLGLLGRGGQAAWVDGVLEVHGGAAAFVLTRVCGLWMDGGAAAMTLGHVVIGVGQRELDRTRKHERVHVRQYERWGPFFLPAYGMASAIAWWRGADPYRENRFEREAYRIAP